MTAGGGRVLVVLETLACQGGGGAAGGHLEGLGRCPEGGGQRWCWALQARLCVAGHHRPYASAPGHGPGDTVVPASCAPRAELT